ncbi:Multidrug resistance protein MdtA precursor [Stieleria bergensis]|uniref:Multidrug resistance protein MdtA n=1 Tax=Stieleria bergensis TaxID=2528025 RepID=A0A517SVT5_9BACT|nr:Multidrug resistance protein MdtA precursor [Planctomycetes bacterium SV_7m_r]
MTRFGWSLPFTIIAAMLLGSLGCQRPADTISSGTKREPGQPTPVKLVTAQQTEIARTTTQPATVNAFYHTEVKARVSGHVETISFDIGDRVTAGQTLLTVVAPELLRQRATQQSQVAMLTAKEQAALADVQLANAQVQEAEAGLEQAKSELARVDASLAASQSEYDRTSDLVERGALERRVLDETLMRRDSQLAAKKAVQSAVLAATADVAVSNAMMLSAKSKADAAKTETDVQRRLLDELELQIQYCNVKAPIDGVITERAVQLGDLLDGTLQQASQMLFIINQTNKLRVHIAVPEVQAAAINTGDAVSLNLPAFADEPAIECQVTRLSGALDPSTRSMMIEAELDNRDGKLQPGMFGSATITISNKLAATVLPSRAVRYDESGNAYVYLVDDQNKVTVSQVTVAGDTGTQVRILVGLEAGQQVIDNHLQRFETDQTIRPL